MLPCLLAEYEAAEPGGRGAVLRREGLYSSHLTEWRKAHDVGALAGLAATRGRPPADPVERDNQRLRDRNNRLDAARRGRLPGLDLDVLPAAAHRVRRRAGTPGLSHPPGAREAELVAHVPNQVWSWDITKLHGPAKWTYFYVYAVLNVFSRKTVGSMVATRESATLAEQLLAATITAENIPAG